MELKNPLFRRLCDVSIMVIGIFGQTALFVQAYKTFQTGSAQDLSFFSYVITFASLSCWLIYGLVIRNPPLIIANIVGVIGALIVLLGIALHG
jgi:MtN3 and saliva related transmembrane protein